MEGEKRKGYSEVRKNVQVLHVVNSLHPKDGGPSRTVVQLADALALRGDVGVTLLCQGRSMDPIVESRASTVRRCVKETDSRVALKLGLPIQLGLNEVIGEAAPSIIHSHGIWLPSNHWTARAARRHKIPLLLHPRGMVQPMALAEKAVKKRIAMAIYQQRDLATVAVMFAASVSEYDSLRALGCRQPVAVLPNGLVREGASMEAGGGRDRPRRVLFLSRIHPLKGLENLVRAWAQLAPSQWQLQIAGPDSGGHLTEIQRLAKKLGVAESIEYLGEVDGQRKADVYRNADLFVLPTFSENFGVVIAEALSYGLPVITTRRAPWSDLETQGCGWWVEIGVPPLAEALNQAMALSQGQREDMAARARLYALRFDWENIAEQTAGVYRWVLGRGDRPNCVVFD